MTSRNEPHVSHRDWIMAFPLSLVAWLSGGDPAGLMIRHAEVRIARLRLWRCQQDQRRVQARRFVHGPNQFPLDAVPLVLPSSASDRRSHRSVYPSATVAKLNSFARKRDSMKWSAFSPRKRESHRGTTPQVASECPARSCDSEDSSFT